MNIGFLGLGIMGSRMAANLIEAGHTLTVWNRTAEKADPQVRMGAKKAASPAEAARGNEVVITMLSAPQAVEETALGEQGFLPAMQPGTIWMNSSTVNPSFTRRMIDAAQARQVHYVDAPVTGSKEPAANAQLTFLVGADDQDLAKVQPLMDKMGRTVIHVGGPGMGSAMKMVFNMLLAQSMLAFSEALLLGQSLGIPRERLFEIFNSSPVVAPSANSKRSKIESGNYEADFPLQWMQKDLELVSVTGYEQGLALPSANVAKAIYMLAARAGYAGDDFSAIYAFLDEKDNNDK